jgi:hypothetical protein
VAVAKTREYGVVKALGARHGWLLGIVAAQAAWSVVLALAAATALALLLAVMIGRLNPPTSLTAWPSTTSARLTQ